VKLLHSNGEILEARDVGPVVYRVRRRPGGPPIKLNGHHLLDDAEAHAALAEVRATGLYDCEAVA